MKNTRPISIPHLVFGLVFLGIAGTWVLGEANNADLPRTAIGLPAVLIAAGVVGLVASLANARRLRRATGPAGQGAAARESADPEPENSDPAGFREIADGERAPQPEEEER